MKVGDYVRFKSNKFSMPIMIGKITEEHYDKYGDFYWYSTNASGLVIDESELVKEPSPNIIDLIEVGDYVNGMKITNIWIDKETNNIEFEFNEKESYLYVKEWNYESRVTKYKLKSIVTKEQFENCMYKIGE